MPVRFSGLHLSFPWNSLSGQNTYPLSRHPSNNAHLTNTLFFTRISPVQGEELVRPKKLLAFEPEPVHKKVPVLVHNGKAISESLIIVEYIDEIYVTARKIWSGKGEEQDEAKKQLLEIFSYWRGSLGISPTLEGKDFGLVDITLVPFYSRFYTLERFGNFSLEAECPALVAWGRRCMEKESVSKSLPDPDKVYQFILELNEKFGKNSNLQMLPCSLIPIVVCVMHMSFIFLFGGSVQQMAPVSPLLALSSCAMGDEVEEDLFNKNPLLLKHNPVCQKVPVLIHNGTAITESLIIVQYIDEVWEGNQPPLLPSDPCLRSQARFWADLIDKKIYDIMKKITRTKGEDQERAKKELIEVFKLLEGELGEKPYFGGEEFGFIDIALVPFCSRFYAVETFGKFSIEAECPKLVAWAERCKKKKSVSSCLPDPAKAYEWVVYVNKKLGIE
ncbi:unnamed protein product [Thlaspi arvense]|uniref:glutathione transferase n=1 Tax=Thlaspi arvense TaxID=13288 RepID=A0AAU9S6R0_THLAR|nr:unnamed protein product [Thlaspi arvense]